MTLYTLKNTSFILVLFLAFSCQDKVLNENNYRVDFNQEEKKLLKVADSIIKTSYFTTLITLDKNKQPRARVVEPFLPKDKYVIWIATNPKSRKVQQIRNNSMVTLHYFDKKKLAYVSLMGNAFLINDSETKNKIWKEGWEKFYPNKKTDYLLIRFIPRTIELISISDDFTGGKITWKPHQIQLYN